MPCPSILPWLTSPLSLTGSIAEAGQSINVVCAFRELSEKNAGTTVVMDVGDTIKGL